MGIFELLLIAIGLAMDAFAVSICKALAMKKNELEKSYYSWALFWHIPSTYASYRILLRNNIRKFSN